MPDKEIARRLYAERYFRKYTQKELSEHLGISPSSYSEYENGKRDVPDKVLKELAYLYHINVNYLRNESNEKYISPAKSITPSVTTELQQQEPHGTVGHFIKTVSLFFCFAAGGMTLLSGFMTKNSLLIIIGIVLLLIGALIKIFASR